MTTDRTLVQRGCIYTVLQSRRVLTRRIRAIVSTQLDSHDLYKGFEPISRVVLRSRSGPDEYNITLLVAPGSAFSRRSLRIAAGCAPQFANTTVKRCFATRRGTTGPGKIRATHAGSCVALPTTIRRSEQPRSAKRASRSGRCESASRHHSELTAANVATSPS